MLQKINSRGVNNYYSLLTGLLLATSFNVKGQATDRPNIIFILADDLGTGCISAEGCTLIKTPNIDRIAKEGVQFTNAFNVCSSSSPSRGSIMTGRYPHNTGCPELATGPASGFNQFFEKVEFFPEILKNNGYWTGHFGKWHIGGTDWNKPSGAPLKGFDYTESMKNNTHYFGGEQGWIPLLNRAQETKKPFFLYLAPYDPHHPYEFNMGPDAVSEDVKESDIVLPPYMSQVPEKNIERLKTNMAKYFNTIRRLDNGVGRLLNELDKRGLADNTLIVFMSDNGQPFPRSKTTLYDSGMRTPLLVRWPKKIKPGQVKKAFVSAIDVAPTILDAGGALSKAHTIMGKSFMPLVTGTEDVFRDTIYGERNWHTMAAHERLVRVGNFVYIKNNHPELPRYSDGDDGLKPPFPAEEFYDCVKDPFQLNNLINNKKYKTQIANCRKLLDKWTKDTGDTVTEDYTPTCIDNKNIKWGTKPGIPDFGLNFIQP